MTNKKNKSPGNVTLDLRGRQSVRATFKLSSKAIEALSLVAFHLGIKQKSLFDHLMDDPAVLKRLADNIRIRQFNKIERVQKTFVLSRRTLDVLELISKDHDTPRDALVEYSIQRLEAVIQTEKKRHEQRKELLKELYDHWKKGMKLLDKSVDILGEDDPFCHLVQRSMGANERTKQEIQSFMDKSKIIEEYG